jgi:hypothetical protein
VHTDGSTSSDRASVVPGTAGSNVPWFGGTEHPTAA